MVVGAVLVVVVVGAVVLGGVVNMLPELEYLATMDCSHTLKTADT